MKEFNTTKMTWSQFDEAVTSLSKKLKPLVPFIKNFYGIPRGGLFLATSLSERLAIPILLDKKKIDKGTVVCDDISDSGETLTKLLKDKRYLRTVTLITKSKSIFQPSYSYLIDDLDSWWQFAWEIDSQQNKKDNTKI